MPDQGHSRITHMSSLTTTTRLEMLASKMAPSAGAISDHSSNERSLSHPGVFVRAYLSFELHATVRSRVSKNAHCAWTVYSNQSYGRKYHVPDKKKPPSSAVFTKAHLGPFDMLPPVSNDISLFHTLPPSIPLGLRSKFFIT